MSGRIRSIKPEWLDDELLAGASDEARVLSVALILMADDHGRGRAALATIAGEAWRYQMEKEDGANAPETLAKASRALRELAAIRFVTLYEVDRQRYFEIRNWAKHQRVDRPGKPRVPSPQPQQNKDVGQIREPDANDSREIRETLATDQEHRSIGSPSVGSGPVGPPPAHEDRVKVLPLAVASRLSSLDADPPLDRCIREINQARLLAKLNPVSRMQGRDVEMLLFAAIEICPNVEAAYAAYLLHGDAWDAKHGWPLAKWAKTPLQWLEARRPAPKGDGYKLVQRGAK